MRITYLGHACFLIEGKEKSVVTDPFADIGYEMKKVTAETFGVEYAEPKKA